jgi:hypothetical protein
MASFDASEPDHDKTLCTQDDFSILFVWFCSIYLEILDSAAKLHGTACFVWK